MPLQFHQTQMHKHARARTHFDTQAHTVHRQAVRWMKVKQHSIDVQKLTNVYTFDDSFHNSAILNCVRKLHSFNVCVFVGQQISESCMKLSLKTVYLHAKYNHRNGPLSQIENDFEDTCHWLQKHISETTLTSPFHRHYQLTQHPFSGSLCPCAHLHTICA